MQKIDIKTYAKINFNLHITGLDYRGYHLLDSVVTSIGIADIISVAKNSTDKILINNSNKNIENTITFTAAELFKNYFDTEGFTIDIQNNIPVSGGLGGSSANAAGVFNALKYLFDIKSNEQSKIFELSKKSGSDTSYMLTGGYARLKGVGEIIDFFDCDKEYCLLIAKASGGVNSGLSFKTYDKLVDYKFCNNNTSNLLITALKNKDFLNINQYCTNELYKASSLLLPEIAVLKDKMQSFDGVKACFMSGSGSSVVGLFENAEQAKILIDKLDKCGYYTAITTTKTKGFEII